MLHVCPGGAAIRAAHKILTRFRPLFRFVTSVARNGRQWFPPNRAEGRMKPVPTAEIAFDEPAKCLRMRQ